MPTGGSRPGCKGVVSIGQVEALIYHLASVAFANLLVRIFSRVPKSHSHPMSG